MPKKTREELWEEKVGQYLVREWDMRWEALTNFTDEHPELRPVPGLFRAVLDGKTMYFVRAIEKKGGIAKGLQRIWGPEQTGNEGYGAQKMREFRDDLRIDIIRLTDESDPKAVGTKLKQALNKYYDPEWSWPHKRRMNLIRSGHLAPNKRK